ncbi:Hypothetical protein ETEE_1365 [Edwardsiella anguillarum ET080813]|uniref:Uncharacterized protein n=2 Tax=Edwardsiella anguillarum TaxID=1821960 RepID=A0A076LQC7_9GAMM|nr:Hypothetical protein ETEE_1365 [Edwardsiella anguillarum ET080813]
MNNIDKIERNLFFKSYPVESPTEKQDSFYNLLMKKRSADRWVIRGAELWFSMFHSGDNLFAHIPYGIRTFRLYNRVLKDIIIAIERNNQGGFITLKVSRNRIEHKVIIDNATIIIEKIKNIFDSCSIQFGITYYD